MHSPRRLLHTTAVALALAAVACGDDTTTGPYDAVAGVFVLESVDSKKPPVVIATAAGREIAVTTGSLALHRDRTFEETWTLRVTDTGQTPFYGMTIDEGTYELRGDSIHFTLPATTERAELKVAGRINGDTLRYTAGARVVVYLD